MDTRLIRIKTMGILLTLAAACATTDPGEQGRMLVDGIRGSDIEMVRQALQMGVNVHIRGGGKNSLLHLAVLADRQGLETGLFMKRESVETREFNPDSSTCRDLVERRIEVVRILLARGIPVNARNARGETPLYTSIADLPLEKPDIPSVPPVDGVISSTFGWRNVHVNQGSDYHRAIDIAARNGTAIRATANATVKTTGMNDPLGMYVVLDHGNGFETVYGHCHLLNAIRGARVKKGEIIGYVGNTGNATGDHCHYEVRLSDKPVNPLPYMLAAGYTEANHRCARKFIELLVQSGADPNTRNRFGRTPLHEAAARNPEMAILLIEHGACPDIRDENGITPLHEASARSGDLVKYILSRNADINRRSEHPAAIDGRLYPRGTTPLRVAILSGRADIAAYLESRGAAK